MKSRTGVVILAGAVAAAAVLAGAHPAEAQYFGRQKVQYQRFDWQVLETEKFEVHYYPQEATAAQDAARMAERWYTRLSGAFQHEFKKKPIVLYADQPDFQQTNTTPTSLSEGTGGFTDALRNRVVMPFTGVYADNDHVLGHELVHVFQYDLAAQPGGGGLMGMSRLPGWLIEGMAEYLSLGRVDAHTAMWLRDAALRGELPTITELTRDQRYFPYRYGQALWAFIAGRWGDRAVPALYRYATRAGWDEAVQRVLGVNTGQISQEWITATREQYLPLLVGKQRPQDAGDPVLVDKEIGAMNLAPVVSPDGRFVAFFGRREIFTIDLYVADAQTGKIVKKLTSPGRSAHIDALSFISSSGTWSPDGRKFAFVVYSDGDQRIAILDVNSGGTDREVSVEGVGGVQNPSWSPDGKSIAFTGMAGGISDLYLLDLESGRVRQLTNDRFADLQPAWSPDGRTLAFATDRGTSTDFRNLTYGNTHIALYDVAGGSVQLLDIFPAGKHINPQYSPDGRSLYFIADPDGFSNVYRLSLADRQLFKVTDIATGISGITNLSPAMSVAARTGRMVFSVFENSGNNVYGIDAARTTGAAVNAALASAFAPAALLPPGSAPGTGMVAEYLADVSTGLPEAGTTFPTRPYKSGLGLEYIGPPSIGVGVGTGPYSGGGAG
ncbi:MAG: peptidase S9, partial [Gemmatimonadetes bacterium]|nr:peptidase S9 [Gemmatimonadota bacterium]